MTFMGIWELALKYSEVKCLGDGGIDTVSGVNCSVPLTRHDHIQIKSEEWRVRSGENGNYELQITNYESKTKKQLTIYK